MRNTEMASDPKRLQAQLAAAVPDVALTFRPMFGGILAYADGKPVASLSNVGLALKLAAEDQDALLRLKGAKRLQYEPGQPPSKSYIVVPPSLLKDTGRFHDWVLKSVECIKSSQKSRAKRVRN
jgi:TfoX/Sxy family transcriptional regulator of competence genes